MCQAASSTIAAVLRTSAFIWKTCRVHMKEVLWESPFHQRGNRPGEVKELSDSHTVIEPPAWINPGRPDSRAHGLTLCIRGDELGC